MQSLLQGVQQSSYAVQHWLLLPPLLLLANFSETREWVPAGSKMCHVEHHHRLKVVIAADALISYALTKSAAKVSRDCQTALCRCWCNVQVKDEDYAVKLEATSGSCC